MSILPSDLRRAVRRVGVTAQNVIEVARFGGFVTEDESTPYTVAAETGIAELRRYGASTEQGDRGPVIALIPPLMMTAEVWDVSPATSAVGALLEAGADPWVIDFGSPEEKAGGRARTLTEHVVAVAAAVDIMREITGRDVHLAGYSQGGMFAYQAAAFRRSDGVASVITFGSPIDVHQGVPLGLPQAEITELLARAAGMIFGSSAVPGWVTRTGFKLMAPVKTVTSRAQFIMQLHDRDSLIDREPQRRFLDGEGFIAWPGPALAEFASQFIAHNRMLAGGFVIEDHVVTLADITCPILIIVGEVDDIAPPGTVRAIDDAAPSAEVREVSIATGHFGLVVGSRARNVSWPAVATWVAWQESGRLGPEPDVWGPVDHEASGDATFGPTPTEGVQLALQTGLGVARGSIGLAQQGIRTASTLADGVMELLPRLLRLERVDRDTRVSMALLADERARDTPDGIFFLHGDRAHSWAAAKHRIDAVVSGLLDLGVRHGEHVGVLMHTRPTALALVAALNRIGAVAVLLRPDGDVAHEIELGEVRRLIVDPDHLDTVNELDGVSVAVLGGGPDRDLGPSVIDMEQIDVSVVALPGWYRPNPGRAGDLAFVLFTGRGDRLRANRISNGRWALSAYGTASAARLTVSDTVFGATPVFHPSGLLTAIGGAIAGSSRLALVTRKEADQFWTASRRSGATVVSYTWTSLRSMVDSPPNQAEKGAPIRLFVGSGMPVSVWRRVKARVPNAAICEFYASTEGGVVLANVTGKKIGAKGRPLPGSVKIALATWDLERDRLLTGEDGFATECRPGQPGMLLAKTDPAVTTGRMSPLRGVFRHGDAWVPTGDLFRKDDDGDHWLLGSTSTVVRTPRGVVLPVPIEDRLGRYDAVDLATVYGVATDDGPVAVAAVMLRAGMELDADAVTDLFDGSSEDGRPDAVRVVDDIPRSAWFRPINTGLRAEGLPRHRKAAPVFRWVDEDQRYRPR